MYKVVKECEDFYRAYTSELKQKEGIEFDSVDDFVRWYESKYGKKEREAFCLLFGIIDEDQMDKISDRTIRGNFFAGAFLVAKMFFEVYWVEILLFVCLLFVLFFKI